MVQFNTKILKFAEQGEKTGWTYIEIPADIAQELKPGNKKSFRVKGKLDNYTIKSVSLLPMGGGGFIMALNASMRKGIGKRNGAMLKVQLEADNTPLKLSGELLKCLSDEPKALERFKKMPMSHQHYFSNWIRSAKTEPTKTKRITMVIKAMLKGQDFGQMLREERKERDELGR
jgi:predicted peptidase